MLSARFKPYHVPLFLAKYAYLTEVVVRDPTCEGAVQRAQLIIASIDYTK